MLNKVTFRATFITLCTMLSAGAYAIADAPRRVDIPAGELSVALLKLSKQYGADLVYRPEQVHGLRTHGAHGSLTTEQAATQLLQGTPLELRTDSSGAMLIAPPSSGSAQGTTPTGASNGARDASDDSKEAGKKSSQDFRVAQVDQGKNANAPAVAAQSPNSQDGSSISSTGISEIIVTAQKRNERLQDVPVPVTVLSAEDLVQTNALRLQDYFNQVPGLSVAPIATGSFQLLSIRGVATGAGTNPTVGITVDDVPYGSSTNLGGGDVIPDIDPGDLARVEVLRGPQGTLYGASSMGGLIKFVTVDPTTDSLSGRVEAGTNSVYNGAQLGYNVRASGNIPLSDTLAIRLSGFTRQDPGYIDNPVTHVNGVNEDHVSGGRISALWKASDEFSLKLSALYQNTKADGLTDVNQTINGYTGPPLGDLQQNYLRGIGGYDRRLQAYSATITAKLGSVNFTAISGYNINQYTDSLDFTYLYGPYPTMFGAGITGSVLTDDNKTDKFTQEIRFSDSIGRNIDWLAGAFYTHEDSQYVSLALAVDPLTVRTAGVGLDSSYPTTYQEYAAFTDVTFHFTDRFDVQIGARESEIKQTIYEINLGPYDPIFFLGAASPVIYPEVVTKDNAFTYLVTPRFRVSQDLMVYARLASGYRPGGPNATPGEPLQFFPDKTENYEIGVKGDFLNHTLVIDASLYYLNWKNIQLGLSDPNNGYGYNANGGGAKSQGLEFSVESKPWTGMTLSAWLAISDAELTEAFPPKTAAIGVAGDKLPYTSRFSGNFSLEQDFSLGGRATGFVGGAVSYVGERQGEFPSIYQIPPQRQDYPAYAKTDLRAGVRYDTLTANFYVNNVTDRRALLAGGLNSILPYAFTYIQPRTVGLSLVKTF